MLVDLDNNTIQWWKNGILQSGYTKIYSPKEIGMELSDDYDPFAFYVTVTLFRDSSACEIVVPQKYNLENLEQHDNISNIKENWKDIGYLT